MTNYVLDASVALKWFLPRASEPLAAEAVVLARQYAAGHIRFLVPDLFFAEFASVMWKAERRRRCSRRTADQAVEEVLKLGLPSFATPPLLPGARGIARTLGCTVYDGIYLSLAVDTGASMITADERLVRAVGARLPILWLGAHAGTAG